jgi:hypothetical protein
LRPISISVVGIDDGALRRGIDRYEELTCEGEKPLTTLVVLLSEVALVKSEDTDRIEGLETESGVKDLFSVAGDVISSAVALICCGCGIFAATGGG